MNKIRVVIKKLRPLLLAIIKSVFHSKLIQTDYKTLFTAQALTEA